MNLPGNGSLHDSIAALGMNYSKAYPLKYLSRARSLISSPTWEGVVVGKPLEIDREWILRQMKGGLEDWEVSDPDCGLDLDKYTVGRGVHQISKTALQTLQLMKEALEDACQAGRDLYCTQGFI